MYLKFICDIFEDYAKNDLGLWIYIALQGIYHSFYGYNCWIYIAFTWIFMSAKGSRKVQNDLAKISVATVAQ